MAEKRSILFVSGLDFFVSGIQVIRLTPEAYCKNGWNVHFVVSRNNSKNGSYYYQDEYNPPGIVVDRIYISDAIPNFIPQTRAIRLISGKITGMLVILRLMLGALKGLRGGKFDVVYGMGPEGVLAVGLLRWLGFVKAEKTVSRFFGIWGSDRITDTKNILKKIWYFDQVLALRSKTDLCIITDDGTQGDEVFYHLNKSDRERLRFWVNGTDIPDEISSSSIDRQKLGISAKVVLLSVSRLERWKRVDRGIDLALELQRMNIDFTYIIAGDGSQASTLRGLVAEKGLESRVRFLGAVPQRSVFELMNAADFFISMYDLSNVGNPLLEAIRLRKIVVTLNNGDTGRWIRHGHNGLIYDVTAELIPDASRDIMRAIEDPVWRETLTNGVDTLARERLWTWEERLNKEVADVEQLIHS